MAGGKARLKRSWKFLVAIIAPLILLPVFFADDDEMIPVPVLKTGISKDNENVTVTAEEEMQPSMRKSPKYKLAYIILIMAVYWAFEIIPLPITALFPLVLFPLFGIDDAAEVSKSYMKESNTIFLGGAIVALAIEFCNLHRRVALRLITIVGVSPRRLMFGIMAVVSILSMWISNTTCTTMIVPIICAIVDEIHEVSEATNTDVGVGSSFVDPSNTLPRNPINSLAPGTERRARSHSQPAFTPLVRPTTSFSNAAFRSHRRHSQYEDNDRRSTLGVLEGRRPEIRRPSDMSTSCHSGSFIQPITNNHLSINKPVQPRQLTLVQNELEAEINLAKSASPTQSNHGICSDDPENNLANMKNLSSSTTSECEDELLRQQNIEKEKWRKIKNMYLFALAYAANIGGTATITGTGPNKVFKEVIKPYSYDISQDGKYLKMTFFTWLAFNLPAMLINTLVAWVYLNFKYCGLPKFTKTPQHEAEHTLKRWKEKQVRSYLLDEHKKLGKMTFHEIGVTTVFLLVVILWTLRDPQIFKGWNEIADDAETGDSTAALLGAILLFIIPRNWGFLSTKDDVRYEALLDWSFVTTKLPWGVLLLLGSGYAIGDSAMRTGLSSWIGAELYLLHDLPGPLLLLIVMYITALITEVVSNTAVANVLLPVLLGLSREMGQHPLYLTVPVAVTASYAFMLPVASPVNAIVFAAGDFSIWEMITNGYILNGICVFVFYINTLTLGEYMFDFADFSYPIRPPGPDPPEGGINDLLYAALNKTSV